MEEKESIVLAAMKKAGKPVRPVEVAKSLNLDSKEVSKIIDSLKKRGWWYRQSDAVTRPRILDATFVAREL